MELTEIIDVFLVESGELLDSMEATLLELEKNPEDKESLNALFRAIHTIKGTSGMFGFEEIVSFTHIVENLLDLLREGKVQFSEELSEILLISKDHIHFLVNEEPRGKGISSDKKIYGNSILEKIKPFLSNFDSPKESESAIATETHPMVESNFVEGSTQLFLISLRPKVDILQHGLDPIAFLSYLKKLGTIVYLKVLDSQLTISDFHPEVCSLSFEVVFDSQENLEKVQKVFEFLENDAQLEISPPGSSLPTLLDHAKRLPEETIFLGNLWKEMGLLDDSQLVSFLSLLQQKEWKGRGSDSIPASLSPASLGLKKETEIPKGNPEGKQSDKSHILKVDGSKIDQLINRVGELVVASAGINQTQSFREDQSLQEATFLVNRLINEIREISLKLRMIQIGDIFQKYQRTVRDLGKDLNKEIILHLSGKETELDRTIVEKLSDPLTHLVRNACDHGLEKTQERIQLGKPKAGNIWLDAYHDTGSVVIQIRDDGKGISPERIWQKAIEKGLVIGSLPSNKEEVYRLLFSPGFSTAESVTNVSGRGVGLDVVQRNIESLRGSIHVDSQEGNGTQFTIRLPLTLAIIEGFLVSVGSALYIIPMNNVLECLEFKQEEHETKNHYFPLRGKFLPYIKIRELFPSEEDSKPVRENIVIVSWGETKAGLVVEELFGEFQTVIKPLGSVFQGIKGISGSSILADGRVALILDLGSLLEKTIEIEHLATK